MRNRLFRSALFAALLSFVVVPAGDRLAAQEKVTLTTPVFTSAGASEFRLASLYLNRRSSTIKAVFGEVTAGTVVFIDSGRTLTCDYDGAAADAMMILLNKANLTANSLEKRVTTTCQADGKVPAGTISGTPQ